MSNEAPAGHLRDAQPLKQLGLRHAVAHAHLVYSTKGVDDSTHILLHLRARPSVRYLPTYFPTGVPNYAPTCLLTNYYLPLTLMLSTVLMSLGSYYYYYYY